MPRLRRVDPNSPGIIRLRRGKGFTYQSAEGSRLADDETLARIRELAIPPAWESVWISPVAHGHIQAVGTDQAGRRQYLYHPVWREKRDLEKFDRVMEFGRRLPRLREQVFADLSLRGLVRARVLSCAVRLLDLGFFRIGGEEYAETHGSYGLATMLREHVSVSRGVVTFDYTAKSGRHRVQSVADDSVVAVIKALLRRSGGGPELLAYRQGRQWIDVKSSDINDHLQALADCEVSAKDFRTWNATVLAAVALAVSSISPNRSESARNRAVSRAVKEVADYLGNTPSVCRKSYIDPRIIEAYHHGKTIADDLDKLGRSTTVGDLATQGAVENAVLELLSSL